MVNHVVWYMLQRRRIPLHVIRIRNSRGTKLNKIINSWKGKEHNTFGAKSFSTNRALTPCRIRSWFRATFMDANEYILKKKKKKNNDLGTSQKSGETSLAIPWRDIRYSRIRHWSSVWYLPSLTYIKYTQKIQQYFSVKCTHQGQVSWLTDFKETFKLKGEASLSFLSAEWHQSWFDRAASSSWKKLKKYRIRNKVIHINVP